MGVNAGIKVHGFRKPTIYVELVEGGSLLANTTYYIIGFMRYPNLTYNHTGSPLSNLCQITTTSTHKSIKISQKTFRQITKFEDAGNNQTLVYSERHCLDTGDIIKIDSGSYAGQYTIIWVDYHKFLIDKLFVDDVPVECYTDSAYYNLPNPGVSPHRSKSGLSYYINTVNPLDENGDWKSTNPINRFTDRSYTGNYTSNPTIISSLPTVSDFQMISNLNIRGLNKGIYKILDDFGGVYVLITDGVIITLDIIHDEIQKSGFIYNSIHAGRYFMLFGSLYFIGTSSLNVVDYNITFIFSEVYHRDYDEYISFNNCNINYIGEGFSLAIRANCSKSIIYIGSESNSLTGFLFGDDFTFKGGLRNGSYGDYYIYYTDINRNVSIKCYIFQNKKITPATINSMLETSYNTYKYINMEITSLYWVFLNDILGSNPSIYMMENVLIKENTNLKWHFRFYHYQPTSLNILRLLNVNTDNPDNIKKCIHNTKLNLSLYFYRRFEFTIKGENNELLDDVDIIVRDTNRNSYNTKSVLGICNVDVIEQFTEFLYNHPIVFAHNPIYDTYYNDFEITISKTGYETLKFNWNILEDRAFKKAIHLKKQVRLLIGTNGGVMLKSNPENIGDNRDLGILIG